MKSDRLFTKCSSSEHLTPFLHLFFKRISPKPTALSILSEDIPFDNIYF